MDIKVEIKSEVSKEAAPPAAIPPQAPQPEVVRFAEKDKSFTHVIHGHYLKDNLFFFVGCLCAIIGGSKDHTILISYIVLTLKIGELAGLYFGLLWICYIGGVLTALVNYINMITAIHYYVKL